jgi:dimeric dUTPase (all-alpha-NTP-PPase superfamily)
MNKILIFEKQISNHQIAIRTTKNLQQKNIYKKQLLGLKKYLTELKTHARELKKLI